VEAITPREGSTVSALPDVAVRNPRLGYVRLNPETAETRRNVRTFLRETRDAGVFTPKCDAWLSGFSPEFSRMLGERGWIGMTWPKRYGGRERPALERFVVLEELLAAGAPVAAHWMADRQSGPQILRHGTESARQRLLPAIARGECFVAIGMSEPDSGSDLASVRTTATRTEGGWLLRGRKVWTSHAHRSHYVTVLCRTSPVGDDRHDGLSVLIAEVATEGLTTMPIVLMNGQRDFNEVTFDDVFVPDDMVLGRIGEGWALVTSELALERAGPERFLSTFPLFVELLRRSATNGSAATFEVGMIAAELWTLRRLSLAVAAEIDAGRSPGVEAALVKDLGTQLERRIIDVARQLQPCELSMDSTDSFEAQLAQATLAAPGFTLRGGTSEILRGIVARGLGTAS